MRAVSQRPFRDKNKKTSPEKKPLRGEQERRESNTILYSKVAAFMLGCVRLIAHSCRKTLSKSYYISVFPFLVYVK